MKIEVRNPRTGEIDHWIEPPSADVLAGLAQRLRERQHAWEHAGADARAATLLQWRDAIAVRKEDLVNALVHDTGRLIESAIEVDAVCGMLARWAALGPQLLAPQASKPAAIPGFAVEQGVRPYALAAIISPWNFPLLLSLIDAIPALAAGSAAIVKPSEIAPRFMMPLIETIPAGLPLAFVAGAGETGRDLIDLADLVCFTGSVPTGRMVGEQAAKRFIPAFLELGGKDPAIVLASADLERATSALLWGSTSNAGQACQSIERIYVDRTIFDRFAERLVEKARALRFAHPALTDGRIGPIIAADQIAIIDEHLRDAKEKSAVATTGGSIRTLDGGSYCEPTVLVGVNHSMKVMTEETFGPIMPLMPFDTVDEAVRWANDTIYGLSAAVFGEQAEATAVAQRINAGAVSINDAALTAFIHDGEKHSFGLSGLGGSRMGPASLKRFLRRQAFLVAQSREPDPWWYPSS